MILCVSPNLCYDRILLVKGFAAGQVHRAERAVPLAGGKGLNIARFARVLGDPPTVVGFAGGAIGKANVREARERGLFLDAVGVSGESRVCTLIIDPGRSETVVNETGPFVDDEAVRALRRRVRRNLERAKVVLLTGSLPPGSPEDLFATLIAEAAPRVTILDSSGEALRRGLEIGPTVAKSNRRELEEALGRTLHTVADIVATGRELLARGIGWIIVTLGEEGAVLVSREGAWLLRSPDVERVSAVGAGDSLTAGLAVGLLRGSRPLEAAKLGMAAAACDVTTLLPGTVEAEAVMALLPEVGVELL